MKTRWLDRRIGAQGPYLTLCLSEDEFHAAVKHLKCQPTEWVTKSAAVHTYASPRGITCIVCLRPGPDRSPIEIAGLLVHEAVHVWQEWCDDIGETHPGREQEAYGVQAIAQELMAEYARRVENGL